VFAVSNVIFVVLHEAKGTSGHVADIHVVVAPLYLQ
jgi:hypothetical protein